MSERMKEVTLNVTLGVVSLTAVSMVAMRVYDRFFWRGTSQPESRRISDWRDFGAAGHRLGPSTPAVTIVEFTDFQCGFCRQAAETLQAIRRQYPDSVATIFRHFPLPSHAFAAAAARAVECAARQHAFDAYHDILFLKQDSIGRRSWAEYARNAGVSDADAFGACITDPSIFALVERDRIAGEKLGVDGTPAFLINDLAVFGYPGADNLMAMVRSALDASKRHTGP